MILRWQLDPVLIGTLLIAATGYFLATVPLRKYLAPNEPFPKKHALLFYSALTVLYLAEGSPLHDLASYYLLSAHMLQHLLISYLAAPLIIWGMPSWLFEAILLHPKVKPLARFLTRPFVAAFVFSFFFSVWHFPIFYDGALQNSFVHHSEHLVFLSISILVWWPVMSPLNALPPLHFGSRILYLFLLPLIQTVVFAFITFAPHAIYATYGHMPTRVWGIAVVNDQALAGLVMKAGGLIVFGGAMIVTILRWAYKEGQAGAMPSPNRQGKQKMQGLKP
ncbi:MAG: cytochrome c oxidase assembly protein [Deinococcales bacterium]